MSDTPADTGDFDQQPGDFDQPDRTESDPYAPEPQTAAEQHERALAAQAAANTAPSGDDAGVSYEDQPDPDNTVSLGPNAEPGDAQERAAAGDEGYSDPDAAQAEQDQDQG